jgi:hypothetical protein
VREQEVEQHALSHVVIWAAFLVTVAFLCTGIWYMYLKPLFKKVAGG